MDRGSETQLQVGENLNYLFQRVKGMTLRVGPFFRTSYDVYRKPTIYRNFSDNTGPGSTAADTETILLTVSFWRHVVTPAINILPHPSRFKLRYCGNMRDPSLFSSILCEYVTLVAAMATTNMIPPNMLQRASGLITKHYSHFGRGP